MKRYIKSNRGIDTIEDDYIYADMYNPIEVETPHGKYYVWEELGTLKGSTQHPDNRIVDAHKINTFDGFDTIEEVVEYVKKYF